MSTPPILKYTPHLVLALGLAGGWYSMHIKHAMHTRARFTIGYLAGGIYTPKSGKRYSYKYRVKGKEYEATDGRERNMNQAAGARFVVEYDSLNPAVSTGHFAAAVPDSLPDSPPGGWQISPILIPKTPAN